MTIVENELLRGERTQTVPQQNVWLTAVLVLGNNSERNHVFNELIETAGSEVAKAIGRFCGQAMSAMIVSVNHKLIVNQNFGQLCISANMLTKSVRDLNDAPWFVLTTPFCAGNGKPVSACEVKSLRCAH